MYSKNICIYGPSVPAVSLVSLIIQFGFCHSDSLMSPTFYTDFNRLCVLLKLCITKYLQGHVTKVAKSSCSCRNVAHNSDLLT